MKPAILLIEDEQAARALLTQTIQQAGYTVHTAATGAEACAILMAYTIDIVVTEVQLPDIDERTLFTITRHRQHPPSLIIQTARPTLDSAIDALHARASAYVLKPYAPALLLEHIDQALRERQQQQRCQRAISSIAAEVQLLRTAHEQHSVDPDKLEALRLDQPETQPHELRVGQLVIDQRSYQAFFEQTMLSLTATQYKLLCCLAEQPGQPISGAEIVLRTHGLQLPNEEAQLLLKPHVRNLRRKIPAMYLINVRGYGYQLVAPPTQLPALIS